MNRIIIIVLSIILVKTQLSAQVTTSLSHREGFGGGSAGTVLSLQQLKDSALQNNIAMRSARMGIEAAQQQRKEAFTKYFPNVSGTGLWFNANKGMAKTTITPSEVVPQSLGAAMGQAFPAAVLADLANPISVSMMKNGTIAGITAVQPVFAGGQIVNSNKLAKVGEEVSRLQLRLSENEVERQTEQYYWQLVSLQEKMKTIAAVETLLNDIYKDVDVAVRAGVAMRNDLLQVQLRQNEVESQKLKVQNGIDIVRLLLGQYASLTPSPIPADAPTRSLSPTGEGGSYNFDIVMPDFGLQDYSLPSPTGEGSGVCLLPEYQLLEKQVEAARLQKNIAVGQNLPSVAVGAGYNYHNLLDNDHTFGMVFATVSVPISNWWGGSHAIKRRKIVQQQAIDQLSDNAQLLQIRMQKAYNDVLEARQQLAIAQKSIEQTEENLRLHRDYYRAGTTTMSSLLEAQLLYQQALDRRADAYADLQNKLLEYRQATQ